MNKGRIAAIGSVVVLAATLGGIARSSAQPKGPRAYDPEPDERLGIWGVQAKQRELNLMTDAMVSKARARLGIPTGHQFAWRGDARDSKGGEGVWVSAEPEGAKPEAAPVVTATKE